MVIFFFFFFSSRRRHTISLCDWSSDVCSSDLRDGRPCRLQRPRRVLDLSAEDAPALVEGVQAIALGQPVLERAGGGPEASPGRAVGSPKGRGRAVAGGALALEADLAFVARCLHRRQEVGNTEEAASARDGRAAVGVEAEEVDARPAADR